MATSRGRSTAHMRDPAAQHGCRRFEWAGAVAQQGCGLECGGVPARQSRRLEQDGAAARHDRRLERSVAAAQQGWWPRTLNAAAQRWCRRLGLVGAIPFLK